MGFVRPWHRTKRERWIALKAHAQRALGERGFDRDEAPDDPGRSIDDGGGDGIDGGELVLKFDPNEPRDESGKWTDGGGDGETTTSRFERLSDSKLDPKAKFGTHTDERPGVGMYAGLDNAFSVNQALRGQTETPANLTKIIDDLTADIKAAPRLPEHVTAYRYVGKQFADTLEKGAEFTDPAFVSTSLDRSVITKHKDTALFSQPGRIMTVRLRKGTEALPVKGSSEHEIIVQRGTKFRVANVNKNTLEIEASND